MKAVVLQFCLRDLRVHTTLTGARTREELAQDLEAVATPLASSVWEELAALHLPDIGNQAPSQ